MKLEAPQITYFVLMAVTLVVFGQRSGKPKTGNYNIVSDLIGVGLQAALMWWGGFFG